MLKPPQFPVSKTDVSSTPQPVFQNAGSTTKLNSQSLPLILGIFKGQNGKAYAAMRDRANPYALAVGSGQLNNVIRQLFQKDGNTLRRNDLSDLNEVLKAHAETSGILGDAWCRVAPYDKGFEIDMGNDKHTRVRVSPGKVEILDQGSNTLFYRPASSLPMVMPAEVGDINLLKKYLNMHPASMMLLIGWLSYTLAHPKLPSTKYVILTLQGSQGTGKTSLCNNIILKLIDPNSVGVQLFPNKPQDLAIASQNAHVLCYDNLRAFKHSMADVLCITSTGGSLTTRQLYTDADQQVLNLHAAMVLNGIHSFVDQPDLAQRCLTIHLEPLPERLRKPEREITLQLHSDLPVIMRGLLDLIADILLVLPTVKVMHPERMIDFVRWLAAMEKVQGVPPGVYQSFYSDELQSGQLDTLQDSLLASVMLEFVERLDEQGWQGTPSELLVALNRRATQSILRSREWPQTPISLSKRLIGLQAPFLSQGIQVEFRRGKQRLIIINLLGANQYDQFQS